MLASTLAVAARCERPTKMCSGPCAARGTVRRHLLCTVGGSSCPRVASAYRRRSQKAATTAARSSSATREPLTPNAPMPTAMTRVGMTGEQTRDIPCKTACSTQRASWLVLPSGPSGPSCLGLSTTRNRARLARLAHLSRLARLARPVRDPQPSPSCPSCQSSPSCPSCATQPLATCQRA